MNDFLGVGSLCIIVWIITMMFVEPSIRPESVAYAERICKDNQGWKYIEEGYNRFATVYCKNGAEFNYNPESIGNEG